MSTEPVSGRPRLRTQPDYDRSDANDVDPSRPSGIAIPPARSRHRELRAGTPTRQPRRAFRAGVRPLLVAVDGASVLLATALVTGRIGLQALVVCGLLLVLHAQRGLHAGRLTLSVLDDAPAVLGRSPAATCLAVALGVLTGLAPLADRRAFAVVLVQVPLLLLLRALAYAVVRAVRRRRVAEHPTVVLGAGRVGGQLAQSLLDHPEYGLLPVGLLDSDPLLTRQERPVPLLGAFQDLSRVLVEFRVRNVIVAFGGAPESSLIDLIRTCERFDCEVLSVPRLFEMHATTREMETVWGVPLVRLRRAAFRRFSWRAKRVFDVVASAAGLILLTPVLLVCAAAVRVETGRGILFRQTRIGLDERPFVVLKFRTLKPLDDEESATRWSVAHEARLGPVGKLLRSTSLDELPQLWNILRGDMTLVGPRPERPHFVEEFSRTHARYPARHRVPAGLTGWAQVHGLRGNTSIAERARFDNYYIENWSLWGDVKIVLRTISATLLRRGS